MCKHTHEVRRVWDDWTGEEKPYEKALNDDWLEIRCGDCNELLEEGNI